MYQNNIKAEMMIKVTEAIYWDNWGKATKVFNKGDEVKALIYFDEVGGLESIWAESTIHEGVSDSLPLDSIEVISFVELN